MGKPPRAQYLVLLPLGLDDPQRAILLNSCAAQKKNTPISGLDLNFRRVRNIVKSDS